MIKKFIIAANIQQLTHECHIIKIQFRMLRKALIKISIIWRHHFDDITCFKNSDPLLGCMRINITITRQFGIINEIADTRSTQLKKFSKSKYLCDVNQLS